MREIIKMSNIKKIYNTSCGKVHALDGIDISVNEGEAVAIIGQSGSGKSTLMNIIGFLDSASSGDYHLDGKLVSNLTETKLSTLRKTNIGFIFQSYNLIPTLNAFENTELPLIYRGVPSHIRKQRVETALEKVGLSDRMKHTPSQLSGGQQQRVAIARALASDPRIILADEPSGNLDPESARQITELLASLSGEHTVIMITHDIEAAKRMQRQITITGGKISKNY